MKLKRQAFSYPYIVWMLIFILAPMVLIVYFAFSSEHGGLTLDNLVTALTNEIYMQVLARSVWTALKATVICLLLGYPIA